MKDAKHHLKHVQKKVIKSIKKENPPVVESRATESFNFKRPKTLLNKKKAA